MMIKLNFDFWGLWAAKFQENPTFDIDLTNRLEIIGRMNDLFFIDNEIKLV